MRRSVVTRNRIVSAPNSPHAAPRLRLRACEQGARHTGATSVAWAPQHSAHGALHRASARSVQGFLAGVNGNSPAVGFTWYRGRGPAASESRLADPNNLAAYRFLRTITWTRGRR